MSQQQCNCFANTMTVEIACCRTAELFLRFWTFAGRLRRRPHTLSAFKVDVEAADRQDRPPPTTAIEHPVEQSVDAVSSSAAEPEVDGVEAREDPSPTTAVERPVEQSMYASSATAAEPEVDAVEVGKDPSPTTAVEQPVEQSINTVSVDIQLIPAVTTAPGITLNIEAESEPESTYSVEDDSLADEDYEPEDMETDDSMDNQSNESVVPESCEG